MTRERIEKMEVELDENGHIKLDQGSGAGGRTILMDDGALFEMVDHPDGYYRRRMTDACSGAAELIFYYLTELAHLLDAYQSGRLREEPDWVPVGERLPDTDGWYDVTIKGDEIESTIANLSTRCGWVYIVTSQVEPCPVIAWRERPAPYTPPAPESEIIASLSKDGAQNA